MHILANRKTFMLLQVLKLKNTIRQIKAQERSLWKSFLLHKNVFKLSFSYSLTSLYSALLNVTFSQSEFNDTLPTTKSHLIVWFSEHIRTFLSKTFPLSRETITGKHKGNVRFSLHCEATSSSFLFEKKLYNTPSFDIARQMSWGNYRVFPCCIITCRRHNNQKAK